MIWLSTDVWDDITKGHNKHTGSVGGDVILSCDCEKKVKYVCEQEKSVLIWTDLLIRWLAQMICKYKVTIVIYFPINILNS